MLRDAAVHRFPGKNYTFTAEFMFTVAASPHLSTLPDKSDVVCYTAVSGFVFLRFFAPAILNPKLFNLRHENPVSG